MARYRLYCYASPRGGGPASSAGPCRDGGLAAPGAALPARTRQKGMVLGRAALSRLAGFSATRRRPLVSMSRRRDGFACEAPLHYHTLEWTSVEAEQLVMLLDHCSSMPATLECHCRMCCDGLCNEFPET